MSDKIPNEIWVSEFWANASVFDPKYNWMVKYISEEYHNSIIQEKDKELEKLKAEIKWLLNKITN